MQQVVVGTRYDGVRAYVVLSILFKYYKSSYLRCAHVDEKVAKKKKKNKRNEEGMLTIAEGKRCVGWV